MHTDYVTIMPRQLVSLERSKRLLHCIGLSEWGSSRALGLSWARDRELSPLAARFAQLIREVARSDPELARNGSGR